MNQLQPKVEGQLPGPKAQKIIDRDKRVASPSYIKEYPLVVERGEGPWIYDVDGNRYLDMMAGIAVASTGHCHPKVVSAIQKSAEKFLHICGTDFYYDSFATLLERLSSFVPGMGAKKVFLSNSGTEAVEGAIKLARFHTRRPNIIAFKGAFHGRTMGAISLNYSKVAQRAFFGPLLPGVVHVPYPNPYRCPLKPQGAVTCDACTCSDAIEKELFTASMSPHEVAAIIVEPILGEGGYREPPKKFLQDLRRICDQHKILLIFDEVQSGVGRTGSMFASEHFGVAPDIYVTAKGIASGMPIGAIVAKESVMTWTRGSHGSTYGGNPVCCDAAIATLDVIEGLLPQINRVGAYFTAQLKQLQTKHASIGDIRGPGLMIGCEFINPKTKEPASQLMADLEQLAFRRGLLLLGCGQSTIRFAPPLIITEHEVDVAIRILDQCLTELNA